MCGGPPIVHEWGSFAPSVWIGEDKLGVAPALRRENSIPQDGDGFAEVRAFPGSLTAKLEN